MTIEINLKYNNINDLRIAKNIEEILKCASLGNVKVSIVDCCYIINKDANNNLQITMANTNDISGRSIAIKQQLTNLLTSKPIAIKAEDNYKLNSKPANKKLVVTSAANFSVFASDKINSIDKLTTSLEQTKQELQKLEDTFQTAKKQGGAYANAIFSNKELLKQYTTQKHSLEKTTRYLEIETQQIKKIAELYEGYIVNIDKDDTANQEIAYKSACAECYYLEQEILMIEVAKLAEEIVAIAKKNNSAIVLPGRSLIACAAYIEKNHPDIKVIKIPLSAAGRQINLTNIEAVSKVYSYIDKHLTQASATDNLLIVDYINSGSGLAKVSSIINNGKYENKTTSVAVYGKHSGVKSNEELQKTYTYTEGDSFNHFLTAGTNNYSPLANALQDSTFDEVSPYGKHNVEKIIAGQTEPNRDQDGFDLLKEWS